MTRNVQATPGPKAKWKISFVNTQKIITNVIISCAMTVHSTIQYLSTYVELCNINCGRCNVRQLILIFIYGCGYFFSANIMSLDTGAGSIDNIEPTAVPDGPSRQVDITIPFYITKIKIIFDAKPLFFRIQSINFHSIGW